MKQNQIKQNQKFNLSSYLLVFIISIFSTLYIYLSIRYHDIYWYGNGDISDLFISELLKSFAPSVIICLFASIVMSIPSKSNIKTEISTDIGVVSETELKDEKNDLPIYVKAFLIILIFTGTYLLFNILCADNVKYINSIHDDVIGQEILETNSCIELKYHKPETFSKTSNGRVDESKYYSISFTDADEYKRTIRLDEKVFNLISESFDASDDKTYNIKYYRNSKIIVSIDNVLIKIKDLEKHRTDENIKNIEKNFKIFIPEPLLPRLIKFS